MRKFCVLAIAIALFLGATWGATPASAWEFQMSGSMTWLYEDYTQRGSQGFFGPYNVDAGVGTGAANLNYWWNGARLSQNLVTGSDASKAYYYVVIEPEIKINPAVKLKGRYRLGQWNNPQASYYNTQDSPGTDNALSEGQWTMFWGTAVLPWGTIGVGKRQWKFGTGLQYDGGDGLTTESLVLNVPYGPLDIGIGFYPHRPARRGQTITIDPYDLLVSSVFSGTGYFNHADKSGVLGTDLVGYVVYNNGPLQAGILAAGSRYHIGPEAFFAYSPVRLRRGWLRILSSFTVLFTQSTTTAGSSSMQRPLGCIGPTGCPALIRAFAFVINPTVTIGQFAAAHSHRRCVPRTRDTPSSGVPWSKQGYFADLPR